MDVSAETGSGGVAGVDAGKTGGVVVVKSVCFRGGRSQRTKRELHLLATTTSSALTACDVNDIAPVGMLSVEESGVGIIKVITNVLMIY